MMDSGIASKGSEAWIKGKLVGRKAPFESKEIWAIQVRLQMAERLRELALFNLGIDSKLRACDLTALRVRDICHGAQASFRAIVLQRKPQRPVQFEITAPAREAVQAWIRRAKLESGDYLFPSRHNRHDDIGTRQYARVLRSWGTELALDPSGYGTHSMRRTKASLIYKRTKNLRAVQLLLGHSKIESTVQYCAQ